VIPMRIRQDGVGEPARGVGRRRERFTSYLALRLLALWPPARRPRRCQRRWCTLPWPTVARTSRRPRALRRPRSWAWARSSRHFAHRGVAWPGPARRCRPRGGNRLPRARFRYSRVISSCQRCCCMGSCGRQQGLCRQKAPGRRPRVRPSVACGFFAPQKNGRVRNDVIATR